MGSAQTRNPLKRVDLNFKYIKLKLQIFTYFYKSLLLTQIFLQFIKA